MPFFAHTTRMPCLSKICPGSKPCPSGGNRGAWSHTRVKFKKNPGKRICCHKKSTDHKAAVIILTTIRMDNNLGNNTAKESDLSGERQKANTLYISKLIRVVHFLAWNNLPVKSLYPKMINFLSYELEE